MLYIDRVEIYSGKSEFCIFLVSYHDWAHSFLNFTQGNINIIKALIDRAKFDQYCDNIVTILSQ